MLGSGEEPDPLIMKKVEHRGKIPYHKSTTNHNSGVIAAYAASASLRKISFSQDTTESPADWSLRSSVRFMNWYPLQKLAHATTSLGRPQRDISNTSPLSRPNCRKCSPSTNSRATPGEKSTTALSWMLKSTKWSIFYQIALRTILSNISHNSHPKPV